MPTLQLPRPSTRDRVVALLACVLALEGADQAAVGAAAPELESAFHISNTQLGLLAAISTFVGAMATIPAGVLADRVRRVRLLVLAVALWGVAMAAGAAAPSYAWLLLSRLSLGAVTAAAGPVVASLTGDFFPAGERAKVYGYVLSGELLGAGFGFLVSGSAAGLLSWRWAFGVLAVPAAVLAVAIWRRLPEPDRGGQGRLDTAAVRLERGVARRAVAVGDVQPVEEHILREDPDRMGLWRAVRYVLSIRTNRWLIAASAIGYFFFAGLRTFALVFVRGHFSLSQPTATALLVLAGFGSLAGVLLAGRLADRMIRHGRLNARIVVGAACYLAAAALLLPSLLVPTLVVAAPLLALSAAALSAPNPPLDAARLDIVPARLWGRAEGVRTVLRQIAQAGAPVVFGVIADLFGGGGGGLVSQQHVSAAATRGLQYTFLIMLVPLALNGLFLLAGRRSYPADVATAVASEDRTSHARADAAEARPRARAAA